MKAIHRILTGSIQTTSAHKSEETKGTTVFSRRADSGDKLFSSLKNLFSRTEKSQAKAVVAQAVPEATTESVKADNKKLGRPGPDLRSRVRQVYRELLGSGKTIQNPQTGKVNREVIVSHFDTALHKLFGGEKLFDGESEKISNELSHLRKFVEADSSMIASRKNQLLGDFDLLIKMADKDKEKILSGKDSTQIKLEQYFKNNFDSNFRSILEKTPGINEQSADAKIIREVIVRAVNTELSMQINDDSKPFQKENFEKEISSTLNFQFSGNISSDLLEKIKDAVSISFDFADAEGLKKMQAGDFK